MSDNVTQAQETQSDDRGTATIADRGRTPRKRTSSGQRARQRATTPVLGVHVTPHTVYGVLMRPTSSGYEPIRQFSRQRSGGNFEDSSDVAASIRQAVTPEEAIESEDGVTIRFGEDQSSAADLFLETEFHGLVGLSDEAGEAPAAAARKLATPIVFELKDIIEECRTAGYERPALAFVIGMPDVDYVEIVVPADGGKAEKQGKAAKGKASRKSKLKKQKAEAAEKFSSLGGRSVKRERLLGLLPPSDVLYDKERVAFLPMTPRDGQQRFLVVLPRPEEPVVDSLQLLREQQGMRRIPFKDVDSEVSVLMGMARMAFPTEAQENTAIVRVGTEDTLVILLQGRELHHCDHMRSVTMFDGPDTICSRVLLQQDVQGVGTVHNVIISSEEREDELVQGFSAFYPEARVETMRAGLGMMGVAGPYGPLPTAAVPATGIALKTLIRRDSTFEDVTLLPKQLRKRARKLDVKFAWHTLLVGALLFMSVVFFVGLFLKQASDISDAERRLAEFPVEAAMTSADLQTRIDSLRAAQAQTLQSLVVLDSLLYGTDQWSQTLALVNRSAAGTGGVWVEGWTPGSGELNLFGYATARDKVVDLASRLTASIDQLSFSEIRNYPVYEYRMRLALPNELPAAARFLRERAGESIPPPRVAPEPLAGSVPLAAEQDEHEDHDH